MRTPNPPAPAAVIRRVGGAEETAHERLVKKHLPAWVASGAVHLLVITLAWLVFGFGSPTDVKSSQEIVSSPVEPEADVPKNLVEEDVGLQPNIPSALDVATQAEQNVETAANADLVGLPDPPRDDARALAPPGLLAPGPGGGPDAPGEGRAGPAGDGMLNGAPALVGRAPGAKARLVQIGGGNDASEAAVALGLVWLAKQQKADGSWVFDGTSAEDKIAATGLCLLPFLAAGETHRTGTRYRRTVDGGLKFLLNTLRSDGQFAGPGATMYSHGIATIALCEAYGMTKDRVFLLKPAQAAVNFLVAKQAADGSWGYSPGSAGDTSIVGWQVQALKAAVLAGDLIVPERTVKRASAFLDKVSSGSRKAVYGYTGPTGTPGTSLTAVGLLSRYYIDGWGPNHAGMVEGVGGLGKRPPQKAPAKPDMYYFYYATQVVHFFGGPEWKDWNEGPAVNGKRVGGMRDWLMALQDRKPGTPGTGSWEPDGATIGGACGRVGTTALSLLTLEVYYRHLPLFKRDAGAAALK